jgi:transforming growth factor-beta-induced protein
LPEGTVASLLADPTGALADILLYHVVAGKAMSTDLSDGQMITTLEGSDVTVKIMDGKVYIDDAMVTTADIITDNGVVHVIDAVMTPITTGIRETTIDEAYVSVYPNPASEFIKVSFEVLNENNISLELYDMLGQQIRIQNLGFAQRGNNTAEMRVDDLNSGMYLIVINTGNSQIANKVRVVK